MWHPLHTVIHDAVLEYSYATTDGAALVAGSVGVEAGDVDGDRTNVSVERDGTTVVVGVAASDLVALRAGLNTWSGLVEVAEACAGAVPAHRR